MSALLHPINESNSIVKKLLSAGALVAIAIASLVAPQQAAHAVGRYVGNLSVECDGSDLEGQVVVYLEIGDTFTIESDFNADCLISDPNNILTGEDADHSGSGPGVLDYDETTDPITIDAPGTFTINEDDGDTSNIKTFHVKQGFVFSNPSGDRGNFSEVGDYFTYDEVGLNSDGSPIAATATVTAVSNLVDDVFRFDRDDRPDTDAGIGNGIEKVDGDPGYAEYTVAFHAPGDPSSPIVLDSVTITVKDIDEYQWVSAVGASSYLLSSTPETNLAGRTVGDVLFVEELNGIGSETEDEDHWAVINFTSKSSITIRVGSNDAIGGDPTSPDFPSFTAVYNVLFADVEWESSPTVINLASGSGLADTGVDGAGINGTFTIAGLLTAVGIATMIVRRRRAVS